MLLLENFKMALSAIRANLTRATLTLMIIAVGIICLVGILTAIDALIFSLSDNFSSLGANSFSISPKGVISRHGKMVVPIKEVRRSVLARPWILKRSSILMAW